LAFKKKEKYMKINYSKGLMFLLLMISCSKGGGNNSVTPPAALPVLSIIDVTQARNNKLTTNFRFFINLDKTSTSSITVNYSTLPGTAVAGTDYAAVSGSLTIPANQNVGYIDVPVTADSLRQPDQTFFVQLSTPTNATINGTGKATGTIQNTGTYYPTDSAGYTSPLTYPGYTLVWNDEFNGPSINTSDWNFETGGNGWGNNELEYYTRT